MNKRGAFFGLFGGKKYLNAYHEIARKKVRDIMTKDVITIHKEDSLINAANTMVAAHISSVVVMEHDFPVGILTERDFIKRLNINDKKTKDVMVSEVMRKDIFTINSNIDLFEAQQYMDQNKSRKLVVVENNALAGIITQTDLCRAADELKTPVSNPPLVKDFMTKNVLIAQQDDTFSKIKNMLAKRDVGSVVIFDKKQIKGVFTEFDLVSEFFLNPNKLIGAHMRDIMTAPIICVGPEFNLFQVNHFMLEHNFRRLPVVSDGNLLGIVTQTDITIKLYEFINAHKDEAADRKMGIPKHEFDLKQTDDMRLYRMKK